MRFVTSILLIATLALPAAAGEVDFGNVRPKKNVFKDLPGVEMPESPTALKTKSPCTSEIRNQRWASGPSMPVRVWTCRNGNMIFESTRQPSLEDWRDYQENYGQ